MGNLLVSLVNTAGAMRAFERALNVVQNNVTNSSTPGYVKQRQSLEAMRFQPEMGLPGGILAGDIQSFRSEHAEQAVRRQTEWHGYSNQKASDLSRLEPIFDLQEGAGISGALNKFFEAFSDLSVSPNNTAARQVVIDRAGELARSFNQTASALQEASARDASQIRSVVERVNTLARQLRELNGERRRDYRAVQDAAMDARIHNILEEMSEYVDISTIPQADGTFTVLMGGQTPLVVGENQYDLTPDYSAVQVRLLNSDGADVTSQVSRGRLAALLEMVNTDIPSYLADLDRLAQTTADRVNELLAAGVDSEGAPGAALLTYDAWGSASRTLAVTAITPSQIAAALPSAPGGNGNTFVLADLATSKEIDGFTLVEYYGTLAARVGREVAAAEEDEETRAQLLAQAKTLRNDDSGVSLDEEATLLLAFQRTYQATARVLTVMEELTDTLINLAR